VALIHRPFGRRVRDALTRGFVPKHRRRFFRRSQMRCECRSVPHPSTVLRTRVAFAHDDLWASQDVSLFGSRVGLRQRGTSGQQASRPTECVGSPSATAQWCWSGRVSEAEGEHTRHVEARGYRFGFAVGLRIGGRLEEFRRERSELNPFIDPLKTLYDFRGARDLLI
jgi:hypothetical protein